MHILLCAMMVTAFTNNLATKADTIPEQSISLTNSFNCLKIRGDLTIYLIEAASNEIVIPSNEAGHKIKIRIKNNVLTIRRKSQYFNNSFPIVTLKFKKIDGIIVVGDAIIKSIGELTSDYLQLTVKGNGKIFVNTKSIEVKTLITGSGKIQVHGSFRNTSVIKDDFDVLETVYNQ